MTPPPIPADLDPETRAAIIELRRIGRQIDSARSKLDQLFERRTALFMQLRDGDRAVPMREIAEHARTTEGAVMQAVLKARGGPRPRRK